MDDKSLISRYLAINKFMNSEYNFTTIMAWQFVYETEYTIANDCLLLKGTSEGTTYFYFPLGEVKNVGAALYTLIEHCKKMGMPLMLVNVSEGMSDILDSIGMSDMFSWEERRDAADYIYNRQRLITLSGKKLHGKKNHLNFFNNNFESRLVPIDESNIQDCEKMLKAEISQRSTRPHEEMNATFMALRYRQEFELTGRAMYADDKLAGVILAEIHHGVAIIQIAKSDISFRGASVALFQKFLMDNFEECTHVNMMEDLGLEGLRRAKLSYDPENLIEKRIFHLK